MKRALFLDRDGVIVELLFKKGPKEIARRPEEVRLVSGIASLIKGVRDGNEDWMVIVISNQPDVAKGKASYQDVIATMGEMQKQLTNLGAPVDEIYFCPHHPDPVKVVNKEYLQVCECRKPKPGLLLRASKDYDIDLSNSWMIGDLLTDVEVGKRAGCKTILFDRNPTSTSIPTDFMGTQCPDYIITGFSNTG